MPIMKNKILPIIFLFTLALTACTDGLLYEENLKIKNAEWKREEKAQFKFEVEDTSSQYDLFINVRHGGDYPYRNLYLFTRTRSPGRLIAVDTAQMIFADKQGRWMGKGIGGIYDYQFRFREKVQFPEQGTYHFQIEHGMRDKVVPQITDIGIRIERSSESID